MISWVLCMVVPLAIGWAVDKAYRRGQLHWTLVGVIVSFCLWGGCFPIHD
jgi:hypothetical protein